MTNTAPQTQAIEAYERAPRAQHSGGRPTGDGPLVSREKLTTTLPASVKARLQKLAALYGCPISDVISTLVFTLVEAQHHPGTPHHEMVEELLSGSDGLVSGRVGPDSDAWRRQAINEALLKAGQPVAPYWQGRPD